MDYLWIGFLMEPTLHVIKLFALKKVGIKSNLYDYVLFVEEKEGTRQEEQ